MFIHTDELTSIERADLAMRLARVQMEEAVDALLKIKGLTPGAAVVQFGLIHRTRGRIATIKHVRELLNVDLLAGMRIVDSLADRYGAHFTQPSEEIA